MLPSSEATRTVGSAETKNVQQFEPYRMKADKQQGHKAVWLAEAVDYDVAGAVEAEH